MINNLNQIVIGTVQFGLDYGVSNKAGKTHRKEVQDILSKGYKLGIRELDTAPSYGDAETIILEEMQDNFKVNTKFLPYDSDNKRSMLKTLDSSIEMFGENLNSVAIHKVEDLLEDEVVEVVESLRESERIKKIGVSIYSLEDLSIIKDRFKPDFIQLPFNIYDQRFNESDLLESFKLYGCEIHVRSVFLQGLLLMGERDIPKGMASIISMQKQLIAYSNDHNISVYKMCLSWVMSQAWVDKVVVGVNDVMQLEFLVKTIIEIINENKSNLDCSKFRINDPLIVNPANWS